MWNTEVPYLLTSGSWDYTIRVWDTRDGTCLDTVYDHGADVYGAICISLIKSNEKLVGMFFRANLDLKISYLMMSKLFRCKKKKKNRHAIKIFFNYI